MGKKITKAKLAVKVNLYRLVVLMLGITVAGLVAVPALADFINAGGSAPKIGSVENYYEAEDQSVSSNEGDLDQAGGKRLSITQDFLGGFEVKGTQYIDANGLRAISAVEKALIFRPTTSAAFQLIFEYANKLPNNEDLWVRDFHIDMITDLVSYNANLNCGTTTVRRVSTGNTYAATSSDGIINDWQISKTFDSGTGPGGLIKPGNATGTADIGEFYSSVIASGGSGLLHVTTTFDFLIKTDEAFTCTLTPGAEASSTDLTGNGFTGAGRAHMDIQHRNN